MREFAGRYIRGMLLSTSSDELLREQYRTLTRLIPFLYAVCIATAFALTIVYTLAAEAPLFASKIVPLALVVVMMARRQKWIRARAKAETVAVERMLREMRATEFLGPLIAGGFAGLTLYIMRFATPLDQSLAMLAVWITAAASAFCLTALPVAGMAVIAAATTPLIGWMLMTGITQFMMLGALFSLTSFMMMSMLWESFARFRDIVNSRIMIDEKQKQTEAARQAVTVMAYTDALTDLPNRRHFEKLLHDRVSLSGGAGHFAIGMLDLDGFKPINDIYGHAVGDEVLVQVAARLRAAMQGKGEIARVGGDEFAIIANGLATEEAVKDLGAVLKKALEEPIMVGTISARLTCSSGFSIYPISGRDPARLIDRADMALYKAKANHRGETLIFDSSYETTAFERALIEQELRAAVSENGLTVHFQPIINLADGKLTGFEALARWQHPKLGSISPAMFVPIAEQIGLVEQMTEGLLRKATSIAAQWPNDLVLAFNLSADQLVKPNAGLRIISILAESHFPPHRFEAEVTETAIMKDVAAARRTIDNLKAAGCRVSLDDFGTGYSSLSQIKDLPLDKIKIDKSFVDQICDDTKIASIVRSIITMCEHLEVSCVAEGIEHAAQLQKLKEKGCEHGQGYLFSRPIPKDEVLLLLADIAQHGAPAEGTPKAA
jgi:diguanylate cyclase (GGDEF)-like protein